MSLWCVFIRLCRKSHVTALLSKGLLKSLSFGGVFTYWGAGSVSKPLFSLTPMARAQARCVTKGCRRLAVLFKSLLTSMLPNCVTVALTHVDHVVSQKKKKKLVREATAELICIEEVQIENELQLSNWI